MFDRNRTDWGETNDHGQTFVGKAKEGTSMKRTRTRTVHIGQWLLGHRTAKAGSTAVPQGHRGPRIVVKCLGGRIVIA